MKTDIKEPDRIHLDWSQVPESNLLERDTRLDTDEQLLDAFVAGNDILSRTKEVGREHVQRAYDNLIQILQVQSFEALPKALRDEVSHTLAIIDSEADNVRAHIEEECLMEKGELFSEVQQICQNDELLRPAHTVSGWEDVMI